MTSVRLDVSDGVATITLCRPEVLNALDSAAHRALAAAIDQLDADPSVGAVVVAGEGRAFCSGSDLREIGQISGPAEREYVQLDFATKNRIAACRKPVVAAIQGHCVGGGLELALACDLRIAADDVSFALPEVSLGSLPGSGGLQRLPEVVGIGVATEWIMTGRQIHADEAYLRGLVNRVVPLDQLADVAREMAANLAAKSPLSLHLTKVALHPQPDSEHGLVAAFQMLAGDACHAQPSYSESTRRFAEDAPAPTDPSAPSRQ